MQRIIALNGLQGAGKSTVQDIIAKYMWNKELEVTSIKFAQPLYDMQNYIYERIGKEVPYPKDRFLLQWLGCEFGRDTISKDLWTDLWKKAVRATSPKFIILNDDVRFENEAIAVREMGGVIIQVVADEAVRAQRIELKGTTHASEAGIPFQYITACIYNNGSIEDLTKNIHYLLDTLKGDSEQ